MIDFNKTIEAVSSTIKRNLTDFFQKHDQQEEITPDFISEACKGMRSAFAAGGLAGMGKLFSEADTDAREIKVDGEPMRLKGKQLKRYMTPFGNLKYERSYYQSSKNEESVAPVDVKVGAHREFAIPAMRESIALASSYMSSKEIEFFMDKVALHAPKENAVANLIERHGWNHQEYREEIESLEIEIAPPVPKETKTVVFSADGASVLMREPKPGETRKYNAAYKIAMVGAVSMYGEAKDDDHGERLSKLYQATAPEPRFETFRECFDGLKAFVDDALVRETTGEVTKVALMDGARNLWSYINGAALFDDCLKLIDYWHAVEHLCAAGKILFGDETEAYKKWKDKMTVKLKSKVKGAVSVAKSIDYYAGKLKLSATSKDKLKTESKYFKNNQRLMNYHDFIERQLPIGSGPVEAACKTLVKQRLCKTGAKWSKDGAQDILTLRSKVKADRWNAYWKGFMTVEQNNAPKIEMEESKKVA